MAWKGKRGVCLQNGCRHERPVARRVDSVASELFSKSQDNIYSCQCRVLVPCLHA